MPDPSIVDFVHPRPRSYGALSITRSPGRLGAAWIHLTGELDLSVSHLVAEQLRDAQSTSLLVVADLRDLDFIDCAGIAVLVGAEYEARRAKRSFVVMRGGGQVDRMLEITCMSGWLEIVDVRGSASKDLV